jgi:hypothetical protein
MNRDDERQTTRQERLEGKEHLGDETPAPSQGGTAGGTLNEKVGARDEEKRAFERPGGATRVRKSDEAGD